VKTYYLLMRLRTIFSESTSYILKFTEF